MGFFKKIFKGVGKVFKKIGRGIKKVVGKLEKFRTGMGVVVQMELVLNTQLNGLMKMVKL